MEYKCTNPECGKIVYRSPCTVKDPSKYVCGNCHRKRGGASAKGKHDWSTITNLKNMYKRHVVGDEE